MSVQSVQPLGAREATKRSLISSRLVKDIPKPNRVPALYIGAVIVLLVIFAAVFATTLAPYPPNKQDLLQRMVPPAWSEEGSSAHLLGTDEFGRDILSRLLYGARISLSVGVLGVLVAGPLGIVVGGISGYFGGRVEIVLMRLADAQEAIPGMLLAILVVAVLGAEVRNLVIVLALSAWVIYARITYSSVRSLRNREFVLAAQTVGVSSARILVKHVLPNMLSPLIVITALQVGRLVLLEAGLSFLGLGVPPPDPSWGNMLADGRNRLLVASWIATFPGIAISLTVLGINLFGDGLRQHFDPRIRTS